MEILLRNQSTRQSRRFLAMTSVVACLLVAILCQAQATAAPRFVAALANGNQVEGERVYDWYNDKVAPRLDNHRLLDQGNPVMWIRDREVPQAETPAAYVEMVCGDQIPGVVREFMSGTAQANLTLPPHLVIEPRFEQRPPREDPNMVIRAVLDQVRRIVWQSRARGGYQPMTLFLRDGGAVRYRAVRMASHSVSLLTETGPKQFSFSEIAELHFPQRDSWDAHFSELAALTTDDESRMMQVETTDGLIATGSLSRLNVLGHGGPDRYEYWIHGVQPGWSLDPMWVPCGNIVIRRFFAFNEMPLYRLQDTVKLEQSAFGTTGSVKNNVNALGGLLRSGDREGGWGYGVRGAGEVSFAVHTAVRQLRGLVGLDRVVGEGGCVRAQVYVGVQSTSPVWQSNHIVGSGDKVSLGTIGINVDPNNKATHVLRLRIDAAHAGRPAGADPWEIRDLADWIDPLLVLDAKIVRQEIRRRIPGQIAAWLGWQVVTDEPDSLSAVSTWSSIWPPMGEYRTLTQLKDEQFIRLVKTIDLTDDANWLIVYAAHREHAHKPAEIEVRIDGELAGTYEAPRLDASYRDRDPLIVPLAGFRRNGARQVEVEIVRRESTVPLDWRAISVVKHMPLLASLFDDQGSFISEVDELPKAELARGMVHSGEASVKVAGGQTVTVRFDHPLEVRSSPKWGQYRYFQFAFRKQGGGRIGIELERPAGEDRAARYDAGQGEPIAGQANRVWKLELPDQWIVMTRDLVSEFGEFNAEALTLTVPDGEVAYFDHIFLARKKEDLDLAPVAVSPELANQKARRELAAEVLKRSLPSVVKLEMADGRTGTGTIIDGSGHVLTTGHLLVNANLDVKVITADGKTLTAKSLGIDRANDLGMAKIAEAQNLSSLDVDDAKTLAPDQMYVGAVHRAADEPTTEPQSHIVGVRRIVDGLIWSDFDTADWTAGGPLLNRDSRVVGVLVSRSRFGGFQYLIGSEVRRSLDRMKRSEVWGEWQSGSGPMVGLIIRTVSEGCRVVEVIPESPAAAAGLQAEDYVIKVDGQEVVSLGEIYSLLRTKNPGDKVRIGYVRGNDSQETDMTLTPRWP